MCDGRLEQIGTPEEVFHRPRTRFVASFMGQTDFLPGEVTAAGVATPVGVATPLGQLPDRPNLADGTQVVVAVRPDDVIITPDEAGIGRVVSKRFIGIATIYQVALPDGTLLHSWQPHHVQLAEGAAVHVTLSGDHSLPCFYNDQTVEMI
jgi:iron(III) transport system ATP-binding protein